MDFYEIVVSMLFTEACPLADMLDELKGAVNEPVKARRIGADAVVVDGYRFDSSYQRQIHEAGIRR